MTTKTRIIDNGKDDLANSATAYCWSMSSRLTKVEEKLIAKTMDHPRSVMLGSSDELQMLGNMIWASNAKKCVEIGMFTGVSALKWALSMGEEGKVYCCDITREFLDDVSGEEIWKEAGVRNKIEILLGPGEEGMKQLLKDHAGTVDFVFIDADKTGYQTYYELALDLVKPRGLIAIDNTLWSHTVIDDKNQSAEAVAFRKLNKFLQSDQRVNISFLPFADGVTLCWKT